MVIHTQTHTLDSFKIRRESTHPTEFIQILVSPTSRQTLHFFLKSSQLRSGESVFKIGDPWKAPEKLGHGNPLSKYSLSVYRPQYLASENNDPSGMQFPWWGGLRELPLAENKNKNVLK